MSRVRSDTERTMGVILEAAERVLSRDPAASMEQIAEAAGVARTTVHRRFTSREALVDAMAVWATRQFAEAVREARPDTTPPLVALFQVAANVLRVGRDWGLVTGRELSDGPEISELRTAVDACCERLLARAREAGVLREDVDAGWAKGVYYALIRESARSRDTDPDVLAARIVDTLLGGLGTGLRLT
ncbi:DNA-binding transcriptional regulator, AcrR family [Nonomuraea maritima]|uniref:DNA-binding transcriptional regulator, AcrR family n=1 Tax=Nonomuraea maritima TaxID=683260 RepID=A0A1G9B4A6_9ACTN|nr:TetR/AcrR family transcriptional regulator [Nonomuraea maritima]SDK34376.1 DNA-binding transcriptional regulator, AcrR family [Nonomuraea maritima]